MKVSELGQVIVKATQFLKPEAIHIDSDGIRHDRAFAMVEDDNTFVNSDQHRFFMPLKFTFDAHADTLTLSMPDGTEITGSASASDTKLDIDHFGIRMIETAEVDGPWRKVLSDFAQRPIRLVRCLSSGRAIDVLPVTFLTTGSLRRLERELGEAVDPSRFRAGFVIDNEVEHEEDGWDGRELRVGDALLRVRTGVPRCQITGFNPSSGDRDQEVMKSLIRYRDKVHLPDGMMPDYETPGFAVFAEVLQPGEVKVGDPVVLAS
ncbi:MAG: MOSC domain-containing protein [Pseudomonadota bacterium]